MVNAMFDQVTQDTFTEYVKNNENVLVYFWAPWCSACKSQDPVLQKIQESFPNQIKVARIDTQKNSNLAMAYQILGTPTLMFFKNGKKVRFKSKNMGKVDRLVGAQPIKTLQAISKYIIDMKIIKSS